MELQYNQRLESSQGKSWSVPHGRREQGTAPKESRMAGTRMYKLCAFSRTFTCLSNCFAKRRESNIWPWTNVHIGIIHFLCVASVSSFLHFTFSREKNNNNSYSFIWTWENAVYSDRGLNWEVLFVALYRLFDCCVIGASPAPCLPRLLLSGN